MFVFYELSLSLALEQTPAPAQTRRKLDQISPRRESNAKTAAHQTRSQLFNADYIYEEDKVPTESFSPPINRTLRARGKIILQKEK